MAKHVEDKFEIKWDNEKKTHNLRRLDVTEKNVLIDFKTRKYVRGKEIGKAHLLLVPEPLELARVAFREKIFIQALNVEGNFGKTPNAYVIGDVGIVNSKEVYPILYYRCY